MPAASERDVRSAISSGTLAPLYLLVGDDAAGKAGLIEAFESAIDEGVRAFACERFYADDPKTTVVDVIAAARTLPFLTDRRLVIVMRAEAWFRPKGRATDGADTAPGSEEGTAPALAALDEYLGDPVPETTIVFVADDVNRTLRQTKLLLKRAVVVEYWGLKGEREVKGAASIREALARGGLFAQQELQAAGLAIDRGGLTALLAHAGTDIAALRNSIAQLVTYAAGRSRVTAEDVLAVARGTALVNDWALVDAIGAGATREALAQLRLQIDEGRSPFQIHGMLGWWIRERLPMLREWQVPAAVEGLLRADLDLKSSADPQIVLERFVVELAEGGRGTRGRAG
jgi:DNA polymerase III delta subunit